MSTQELAIGQHVAIDIVFEAWDGPVRMSLPGSINELTPDGLIGLDTMTGLFDPETEKVRVITATELADRLAEKFDELEKLLEGMSEEPLAVMPHRLRIQITQRQRIRDQLAFLAEKIKDLTLP